MSHQIENAVDLYRTILEGSDRDLRSLAEELAGNPFTLERVYSLSYDEISTLFPKARLFPELQHHLELISLDSQDREASPLDENGETSVLSHLAPYLTVAYLSLPRQPNLKSLSMGYYVTTNDTNPFWEVDELVDSVPDHLYLVFRFENNFAFFHMEPTLLQPSSPMPDRYWSDYSLVGIWEGSDHDGGYDDEEGPPKPFGVTGIRELDDLIVREAPSGFFTESLDKLVSFVDAVWKVEESLEGRTLEYVYNVYITGQGANGEEYVRPVSESKLTLKYGDVTRVALISLRLLSSLLSQVAMAFGDIAKETTYSITGDRTFPYAQATYFVLKIPSVYLHPKNFDRLIRATFPDSFDRLEAKLLKFGVSVGQLVSKVYASAFHESDYYFYLGRVSAMTTSFARAYFKLSPFSRIYYTSFANPLLPRKSHLEALGLGEKLGLANPSYGVFVNPNIFYLPVEPREESKALEEEYKENDSRETFFNLILEGSDRVSPPHQGRPFFASATHVEVNRGNIVAPPFRSSKDDAFVRAATREIEKALSLSHAFGLNLEYEVREIEAFGVPYPHVSIGINLDPDSGIMGIYYEVVNSYVKQLVASKTNKQISLYHRLTNSLWHCHHDLVNVEEIDLEQALYNYSIVPTSVLKASKSAIYYLATVLPAIAYVLLHLSNDMMIRAAEFQDDGAGDQEDLYPWEFVPSLRTYGLFSLYTKESPTPSPTLSPEVAVKIATGLFKFADEGFISANVKSFLDAVLPEDSDWETNSPTLQIPPVITNFQGFGHQFIRSRRKDVEKEEDYWGVPYFFTVGGTFYLVPGLIGINKDFARAYYNLFVPPKGYKSELNFFVAAV
ncbi:MAG: hypothetical protein QXS12_06025 [Candidatus Caldarchaeum sp.]